MNNSPSNGMHPVIYAVKSLLSRLRQNPEVYPIKYYKKNQRHRRNMKPRGE